MCPGCSLMTSMAISPGRRRAAPPSSRASISTASAPTSLTILKVTGGPSPRPARPCGKSPLRPAERVAAVGSSLSWMMAARAWGGRTERGAAIRGVCGRELIWCRAAVSGAGWSGSGGGDDGVGGEAQQDAEQDVPGGDFLQCLLARDRQQLDDDVEDGPGGQGQEPDGQRVVDNALSQQGP